MTMNTNSSNNSLQPYENINELLTSLYITLPAIIIYQIVMPIISFIGFLLCSISLTIFRR